MARIGKPQKSKKHKKIKPLDPIKEVETGSRKGMVNMKPRFMEQEVPKRALLLREQMQQARLSQSHARGKRKKNKFKTIPGKDGSHRDRKSDSPHKANQETEYRYSSSILESEEIITKFKLDRKGQLDVVKTKRAQKVKMRLKERKQRVKDKKKNKHNEKQLDFSKFKDEVQFGDIVHAPPSLSVIPRTAQPGHGVARPGKKSLLLKEIITTNSAHGQGLTSAGTPGRRQLGQTVKRKNLSMSRQHILDSERNRAIDLYREMKNKKMKVS